MILIIGLSRLRRLTCNRRDTANADLLLQEDVFRLKITVYKLRLAEQGKAIEKLLRKDADKCCAQSAKLILLDQLV